MKGKEKHRKRIEKGRQEREEEGKERKKEKKGKRKGRKKGRKKEIKERRDGRRVRGRKKGRKGEKSKEGEWMRKKKSSCSYKKMETVHSRFLVEISREALDAITSSVTGHFPGTADVIIVKESCC